MSNHFNIDLEKEVDGRWIAEIHELPGVLVYGKTKEDAISKVEALALHVIADRLEAAEEPMAPASIQFSFA